MRFRLALCAFPLILSRSLAAPVEGATEIAFLQTTPRLPDNQALAEEPLTCLQAMLRVQGLEVDLPALRAISGEAWAPLLDVDAAVFEPLRERQPLDVLTRACEALRVHSQWHFGLATQETATLAADELRAQRPVLTSIAREEDQGVTWNLITGVDESGWRVILFDPRLPLHTAIRNLAERWSGPVPGPVMWSTLPLFTVTVTASSEVPEDRKQLALALRAWSEEAEVTSLVLPTHAGARRYAQADLTHLSAVAGPAAARQLSAEIAALETLDTFPVIWRCRTMLSLLSERREAGAAFLRGLDGLSEDERARSRALAASLEATAATARSVVGLMWNDSLRGATDALDMLDRVRLDPPLVVDLSAMPAAQRQILRETITRYPQPLAMEIHSTSWGPVLTVDSPEQRQKVTDLLARLAEQMEANDAQAREWDSQLN